MSTTTSAQPTTSAAPEQPAVPQPPAAQESAGSSNRKGRQKAFLIFGALLVLAAVIALLWWLHARQFETTDDAQVDAHLIPVTSRIDGTITRVYTDDNDVVSAGAPLVDLDPRDFQVALDQALAQMKQARAQVIATQPNVPITEVENVTSIATAEADVLNSQATLAAAERDRDSSAAKVMQAEANAAKAAADLKRYQILISKEEVSQQEYDQIASTAKAQEAVLKSAQAELQSAERIVEGRRAQLAQAQSRSTQYRQNAPRMLAIRRATVHSNEASAASAKAEVESAQLKLSYTKIAAPVSGIVMKRSAEIGSHVGAGQQLMQIAQISDVWVTANYKETQLRSIRRGQAATIHVDALNEDFEGTVENIAGATGALASVLPPENATGNYVKVVQRIPVRIRFKPNQQGLERLRPGMSVEPHVRIGG